MWLFACIGQNGVLFLLLMISFHSCSVYNFPFFWSGLSRFKFFYQVMEQCIARLDVAMFNALLRESALDIPTDPISDPIVNSKVLPIPAGDLSFGSGAQLKNSVCV